MKKVLSVFAASLLMIGSAVSCGSSNDDDEAAGIIGKWDMPLDELSEELGSTGLSIESGDIEFKKDGKLILSASVDFSSYMSLKDDSFAIQGVEMKDISYDGKTLSVAYGGKDVCSFERIGDSDKSTMYGEYMSEDINKELDNGLEAVIDFRSAGVTYISYDASMDYTFDEKESKLIVHHNDEKGDKTFDIEFDGDTMIRTDKDGEKITFTRSK